MHILVKLMNLPPFVLKALLHYTGGRMRICVVVLPSFSLIFCFSFIVVQDVGEIHRVELIFLYSRSPLYNTLITSHGLVMIYMSGRIHRVACNSILSFSPL